MIASKKESRAIGLPITRVILHHPGRKEYPRFHPHYAFAISSATSRVNRCAFFKAEPSPNSACPYSSST